MADLPSELWLQILENVDLITLWTTCSRVSHRFHTLVLDTVLRNNLPLFELRIPGQPMLKQLYFRAFSTLDSELGLFVPKRKLAEASNDVLFMEQESKFLYSQVIVRYKDWDFTLKRSGMLKVDGVRGFMILKWRDVITGLARAAKRNNSMWEWIQRYD